MHVFLHKLFRVGKRSPSRTFWPWSFFCTGRPLIDDLKKNKFLAVRFSHESIHRATYSIRAPFLCPHSSVVRAASIRSFPWYIYGTRGSFFPARLVLLADRNLAVYEDETEAADAMRVLKRWATLPCGFNFQKASKVGF